MTLVERAIPVILTPLDHHCGVRLGLAGDRVDDGYVGNGERLLRRGTQRENPHRKKGKLFEDSHTVHRYRNSTMMGV